MATFKDLKGQAREVAITFRHVGPLRERHQVKIGDLLKEEGAELRALLQDPERFAAVLHTLTGRPDEPLDDFLDALDLPTLEAAALPFLEAVLSFSRGRKAGAVVSQVMTPRREQAAAKFDAALDGLVARLTSSSSGGNSPGSSASTPPP